MIQRRHVLFAALAATQLIACGGGDDTEPVELPRQRVQAFWSYTDLKENYVVRTEAQWQATWAKHQPRGSEDLRPQIDFSRFMVLGVTRGTGPDGCHGLGISQVTERSDDIRVEFWQSRPTGTMICTMSLVPLTDFVIVPASAKPVTFVEKIT
jgi:hypothetical protein